MATNVGIQDWGPLILISYPKHFKDSPVAAGVSADPTLSGIDFLEDERVVRAARVEGLPAAAQSQLSMLSIALDEDLELRGVWCALSSSGRLFRSDIFWHRRGNSSPSGPDARTTADLRLIRTLAQQPPVLVAHGSPRDPGAAISAWSITPTIVAGTQGLYHEFRAHRDIDPVAQRAWLEADAVEWFDADGYKNVVYGWRFSETQLKAVAASLRLHAG